MIGDAIAKRSIERLKPRQRISGLNTHSRYPLLSLSFCLILFCLYGAQYLFDTNTWAALSRFAVCVLLFCYSHMFTTHMGKDVRECKRERENES